MRMSDACAISQEQAIDYLQESGWLPEHDRALTKMPILLCCAENVSFLSQTERLPHQYRGMEDAKRTTDSGKWQWQITAQRDGGKDDE